MFALSELLLLLNLNLAPNFSDSLEGSAAYNVVGVEQTREDVGHDAAVVVVLIIEIASPNFYVFQELLPYLSVLVVDKSGKVVDVVRWLVEILDGHRVWVAKTHQVLKHEGVVLPETAPENRG